MMKFHLDFGNLYTLNDTYANIVDYSHQLKVESGNVEIFTLKMKIYNIFSFSSVWILEILRFLPAR